MPNNPDVLDPDDVISEVVGKNDDRPSESDNTGTTFVCDVVTTEGVCGESYPNSRGLGAHKYHRHGIKGTSATARAEAKKKGKSGDQKPTAARKATKAAMPPVTDRAGVYTASLSMAALGCYLAVPQFDHADLDICNAGMPNVGRALAQLAEQNPAVARTCDLVLAGGGGGWIALLMAVVPIAGGIAAHHGVIPESSGPRFGEMIGVAPAARKPDTPPSASGSPEYEVDNRRTADDVIAFFAGTPETVMTDAMTKMMSMAGPITVAVPMSMTPTENPDGHRGSEQLRPVEPVPHNEGAEPESEASVSA